MSVWNDYNKNTENRSSNQLALDGISYTQAKELALDLGCGAMRDTRAFIEAGFKRVDAVDSNVDIAQVAKDIPGVTFYPLPFHEFDFPKEAYDLVNAQNALPFAGPEHFEEVWVKVEGSIARDGVFTGTFFGPQDGWAGKREYISFITKERVAKMFDPKKWEVKKMDEYVGMGKMANGNEKMWHIFSVIGVRTR